MPKTFTPENTEDRLYIAMYSIGMSIPDMIDLARKHFDVSQDELYDHFTITTEYIQTRCIGHDQYDSADYDQYIVIERK